MYSHAVMKVPRYYKTTYIYDVKQVGKWVTACKPDKGEKLIPLIMTTLVQTCT